jgi:hypothetical protein
LRKYESEGLAKLRITKYSLGNKTAIDYYVSSTKLCHTSSIEKYGKFIDSLKIELIKFRSPDEKGHDQMRYGRFIVHALKIIPFLMN